MSREIARRHLEKYGFGDKILELEVSSATVALAALALGCEEARIAKTLSFADGEGAILVVAAGDAKIDNRRFKDCFGKKAKMLQKSPFRLSWHWQILFPSSGCSSKRACRRRLSG